MARVSIKFTKNVVIFVSIAVLIACVVLAYIFLVPKPITSWNYNGQLVRFRNDLRKADEIPVYPSNIHVKEDLIHPLVENVTIVFKDAGREENGYYIVEEFEIVTKMTLAYRNMINSYAGLTEEDMPTFNAVPVENYSYLPGMIENPIIALVHPKYANETSVRNEGHVTYISGKNYEQFDLATIKFLMVILGIKIQQ